MNKKKNSKKRISPLIKVLAGVALTAAAYMLLAHFLPSLKVLWAILSVVVISVMMFLSGRKSGQAPVEEENAEKPELSDLDYIRQESNRALSEMGRLYMSIRDPQIRVKINELMRITDKIAQDAEADPTDIPQIKKFINYYLPTTLKLLNTYDRMSTQEISGETLDRSMKNIVEMLDDAIEAYKKLLDSLFENQALDIETDIQVMNTLLQREGLSGSNDFATK